MPAPLIAAPPYIFPSLPRVVPGGQVSFYSVLGSGSGYSYSLQTNASGGQIDPATGVYSAGTLPNTVDTILVRDGLGGTNTRDVVVVDVNSPTLASIRNTCKQRCDLVNSTHITDPEWNGYINASAQELYDLLVSAYENDYNVADPFIFQTDGITQRYPLPPDFFKLLGVDVQVANTTSGWLPLARMNRGERGRFMVPYQTFYGVRTGLRYKLEGTHLWLLPTPTGGQFIQMLYVPTMTRLASDTDVLNGVNGWEEYVIADVCIKAKVKREEDPTAYVQAKTGMAARIDEIAEDRDANRPGTVVDVRSFEDDPNSGPFGGAF